MHCLALLLGIGIRIGIGLLPGLMAPAHAQTSGAVHSHVSTNTNTATNTTSTWPARPVRIIAPYAPGGVVDLLARDLGNSLGTRLGRSFIIENRPGAGGNIGLAALAKSPADGYTLGIGAANMLAANRALYRALPFDTLSDFDAVSFIGRVPFVLVVHPSVPANDLRELLAAVRATPSGYSYGSSGVGNTAHLFGELLRLRSSTNLVHVPYKSSGEALREVMTGRVQLQFITPVDLAPYLARQAVRPIALAYPTRLATLPQLATFAEQGYEGFDSPTWFGLIGPAGLPGDVVALLHREVTLALSGAEVRARLARAAIEPAEMTPAQFKRFIATEAIRWEKIVRDSGARID
jgi:tripartite-type tricarboxylate transporter receptor subunit TctC